ncbi:MAG: sulfoxide reductase heme-binding subunit YedZ [Rhodospirillaceae bacterium]|nr:sulfoxide reductase heme-binding subunit YedZ [Rhodospirillaceae bacterium]OUT77281.1 MAG: hypothetical protein CBB83_08810 [Rhodospirillaceae bacterium TMED23]|tara:strand:- start:1459 stop:2079 length:621 start_codon:yes stop_codon:yes gene_type:complete
MAKKTRNTYKYLVFVVCLMPLAWLIFAILSDTLYQTRLMSVDPVQKFDRELGDWALIFIILTLSISPIAELSKKKGLIVYRKIFGLFGFFYVCLHFLSYVGLNLQFDMIELLNDISKRNFITIGVIGFILLIPMAATSSKKIIKYVGGKLWKKIHFVIYTIAILGVFHFFMMTRADFTRPTIYLIVILVLLIYRIVTRSKLLSLKK